MQLNYIFNSMEHQALVTLTMVRVTLTMVRVTVTTPHDYSSKNNLTLIGNKFAKEMVKDCPKIDKTCVEINVGNSHLKNWLFISF